MRLIILEVETVSLYVEISLSCSSWLRIPHGILILLRCSVFASDIKIELFLQQLYYIILEQTPSESGPSLE